MHALSIWTSSKIITIINKVELNFWKSFKFYSVTIWLPTQNSSTHMQISDWMTSNSPETMQWNGVIIIYPATNIHTVQNTNWKPYIILQTFLIYIYFSVICSKRLYVDVLKYPELVFDPASSESLLSIKLWFEFI